MIRVVSRCYQQLFRYWYFAGIRFAGFSGLWSVLLYCKLWREHIFKFSRELFFLKNSGEFLFFFKRRAKCTKRGSMPPFLGKRRLPIFLRGSRQIFDTENTDRVLFRHGILVIPEKYLPNTDRKYRDNMCYRYYVDRP